MAQNKVIETSIDSLIPDDCNFNKGTEFGQHLIEESLSRFGAGRSILLDKNNRIIAGNKTIESAGQIGLDKILIVETDGTQIVAVRRKDVDLDTCDGREMAAADNATSAANLEWDEDAIQKAREKWADFNPDHWGIFFPDTDDEESDDESSGKKEISTRLIVECGDVTKLSLLFSELQDRGFKCELKE